MGQRPAKLLGRARKKEAAAKQTFTFSDVLTRK